MSTYDFSTGHLAHSLHKMDKANLCECINWKYLTTMHGPCFYYTSFKPCPENSYEFFSQPAPRWDNK